MTNVIKLKRKKKASNHVILSLMIITALLALILFLMSKIFIVETITVEGSTLVSDEDIKNILGVHEGQNMIEVFMNKQGGKTEYPYVEDIEIQYMSYKKIKISVQEKQIMGYILYMGKYFCLDKDGYVVDAIGVEEKNPEIALIQGVISEKLIVGEKVDLTDEVINTCLIIHSAEKKHELHVDLLNFNNGNIQDIVLTIGNHTVYFGNIENINKKMLMIKKIIENIPTGEIGSIYLDEDGTRSRYEKKIQ